MVHGKSLFPLPLAIAMIMGAMVGGASAQQAKLTAADIVNRNVSARGGLQAWRAVQTLSMSGKMEAGGNNRPALSIPGQRRMQRNAPSPANAQAELPFRMDLKRTRKSRIELDFNAKTAVQIYDGANGWMMRPYLNRIDYEPYTAEQTKAASEQADLDGPLIDYAAKGTSIELSGNEKVDDRDNYKLKLTLKDGYSFHVWIDGQTFLESKIEGTPRRLNGQYRPVEIYMKDYRPVDGLTIPFLLETRVNFVAPGAKQVQILSEKISIDKVTINPRLDDARFLRPGSQVAASAPHGLASNGTTRERGGPR